MLGGPSLKARTQYISVVIPPPSAAKREQLESGYGSTNSTNDDSLKHQRVLTAKSRKHRRQTPTPTVNTYRSKSVLHSTHHRDSIERSSTKQQQRLEQLNLDPINNYRRLKTANSRISIEATPFQQIIPNQKIYNSGNSKQICSKRTDIPTEHSRKLHTPIKKVDDIVDYSDDWDSDYSDDWELDINDIPKSAAVFQPPVPEPKTSNNFINLVPFDPAAFEASFCCKRQAVIDNMSYRQAINSWKAKTFHDVVKLIIDLSSGKSLIDRAWIIFYWVSQNIEYDVEAYFSGNIRHQTSEDIFASRKGVCDAFGTIFETLCTALQIECKKISGYAKGYSFKIGQESFARTNHAWNVIRLEEHWYLVDPTWGEGYLDILVRAPSDTVLTGDITQTGSGKIKNGILIQYDADRQLWQCRFAPQHSGSHTLTLFARQEKQTMKSKTNESKYSCAVQFSLHVPTGVIKATTFPLTYGLFTERKCQIFEPLDGVLKSGSKVTIHCRIPGAYCARLLLDGNWLSDDLIKDDIFKKQITIPRQEIIMYVKFSDKRNASSYDGLFCYSIK